MQGWQTTYLGMRELPRDISGFELQAFFTFSPAELELIDARRGDAHKLGLALHIGFLRMTGRVLDAFRIVPPALWRHLGSELGIDAPELASAQAEELLSGAGPVQGRTPVCGGHVGDLSKQKRAWHQECARRGRGAPRHMADQANVAPHAGASPLDIPSPRLRQ